MAVLKVTGENFQKEVVESDQPVLLDFWATWCGPCKMLSPVVEALSEELTDVKVGKVNVDEEMDLASKFQVMAIPTLLVIKNGEVVNTSVGVKSKNDIIKMLSE
ncbi:MAG: thioredoxin [Lachnospiraceae bacterium]|nr:thioredoxin [Lachnospiraceae bacterium]